VTSPTGFRTTRRNFSGEIAAVYNGMVDQLSLITSQVTRVDQLSSFAAELNSRPHKTLGRETPAKRLSKLLAA
jgi:IS30 family transposase